MRLRKATAVPLVREWGRARRPAWTAAEGDVVCAALKALSDAVTPHVVEDVPLADDEAQRALLERAIGAIDDWLIRAAANVRHALRLGVPVHGRGGAPALGLRDASVAELAAINGVSAAAAERILRYLARHPDTRSIDALDHVPGIGPAKLKLLKDHTYLGQPRALLASPSLLAFCWDSNAETYLALLDQTDLDLHFGDANSLTRRSAAGGTVHARFVRLLELITGQARLARSPAQGALASHLRRALTRQRVRRRTLDALAAVSGAVVVNGAFATQMLNVIDHAERELRLSFFVATASRPRSGVGSADIIEAIEARAAAGVSVRVILDRDRPGDPYLSHQINRPIVERLSAAGILVRQDKPERLMHSKFLVADEASVIVGSHNLTSTSIAHSHELGVRLDGASLAKSFAARFDELWDRLA